MRKKPIKYNINSKNNKVPNLQFGDLLESGPLSDLFKSAQQWNSAWRGDIFAKNGLLNKTIYQNKNDLTPEKMYGDPNSPFYDPNYKANTEAAKNEAKSDYQTQYQMYLDAKEKAAREGTFFDESEWQNIGNEEDYINKVMSGNANISQYNAPSNAQKLQQTAQGIFTGLQYQGAYQKPEPVKLEQGFQGTQWAQYGKNISNSNKNNNSMKYNQKLNINTIKKFNEGGMTLFTDPVKTVKNPIGAVPALRKYGYLKDYTDQQIMDMKAEDQEKLISDAMKDFNENNPRSSRNTMATGEVVEQIETPLTAIIREVTPAENTVSPEEMERQKFLQWYSQQPEGTVQVYNGRKIKIDRSGGKSDGMMRGGLRTTPETNQSTPEKVKIMSGLAKEIYNKKYGGNINYYQGGGMINYTGYTPGTSTANNKINVIPGDRVTSMPEGGMPLTSPVLTIANFGKKKNSVGTNHGMINILKPGEERQVLGANSMVELPMKESQNSTAKYGTAINYDKNIYGGIIDNNTEKSFLPNFQYSGEVDNSQLGPTIVQEDTTRIPFAPSEQVQRNTTQSAPTTSNTSLKSTVNSGSSGSMYDQLRSVANSMYNQHTADMDYLQQIAGPNEPYGPMYSTPEFNKRMLQGAPTKTKKEESPIKQVQTVSAEDKAAYESMMSNPDDTYGNVDSKYITKTLPKNSVSEIYNIKGDKTYEYAKDENGNWITRRKGSNSDWKIISTNLGSEDRVNEAIKKLDKQAYKVTSNKPTTNTGSTNTTSNTAATTNDYDYLSAAGIINVNPIKKYKYGGEINSDHSFPIHPITEEFTEIQTEKGETVFLPDGTIVEVKATDLHKNMDKDKVTDILPEGAYIFSNDNKMKLKLNEKIGGVALKDMKVGKTVFEYKENEITTGPKDIFLKDIFNGKDNLTPSELTRNIKNKFEVRDMKNDFFVERANNENKAQRVEYLNILKTFSEFKKPKSKREIPKAQYGMNTSLNRNVNISEDGSVEKALLGNLIYLQPSYYVADYFIKQKAEREANKLKAERQAIWNQKEKDINKTGTVSLLSNLATTASAMNVPDIKYNDFATEFATTQEAYNRQKALNQASAYGLSQNLGSAGSLARYSGNNQNLSSYLAQSNANVNALNQASIQGMGQNEIAQADALNRYRTAGISAYNEAENARRQALQNATTVGLQNIGSAATDYTRSIGDFRFDRGMDKMSYDQMMKQMVQQRREAFTNKAKGVMDSVGQVALMAFAPGAGAASGAAKGSSNFNVSNLNSALNFTNPQYMSSADGRFNNTYRGQFDNTGNSNLSFPPGATTDRTGTMFNLSQYLPPFGG